MIIKMCCCPSLQAENNSFQEPAQKRPRQDEGATRAIDTESIDGTLGGEEIPVVEPSGVVDPAPPLASSTDRNGDPTNSPETSEPTAPPEGKLTGLGELRYSFCYVCS